MNTPFPPTIKLKQCLVVFWPKSLEVFWKKTGEILEVNVSRRKRKELVKYLGACE